MPSNWMLNKNILFNRSSPMLLVVKNQTFPPFGIIVRIVSLTNKMANNTTHGLKQYKIWFFVIIFPKKMPGKRQTCDEGPFFFYLG